LNVSVKATHPPSLEITVTASGPKPIIAKQVKRLNATQFITLLALIGFLPIIAAAESLPQVKLARIFPALKLERPLWMSEAPDGSGRFFIVEQEGRILVAQEGSAGDSAKVFFDIRARKPQFDNEDGLLSMAFHPGFQSNGLFYVYYTQKISGKVLPVDRWRCLVSEFRVSPTNRDAADLSSERILLDVSERNPTHKGGEVAFGPDGMLYVGMGDGSSAGDPLFNGQNPSVLMGKFLRIDVNRRESPPGGNRPPLPYGIPADNPFVAEPDYDSYGARKEIYALGLRNPWRFSWDRLTGDLWCGDVGQECWEEVDLIVKGGNYGWSVREGAHHFKPGPEGAHYIDPVIEFPHNPNLLAQSHFPKHAVGTCVVGGYVYRGRQFPKLQGVYIYADFTLGTIFGMRWRDGKVIDYGTLLEQPKNIDSFAEDISGGLYAITLDGCIFAITAK
jgi:glucose/arabinose dehydrogenase